MMHVPRGGRITDGYCLIFGRPVRVVKKIVYYSISPISSVGRKRFVSITLLSFNIIQHVYYHHAIVHMHLQHAGIFSSAHRFGLPAPNGKQNDY